MPRHSQDSPKRGVSMVILPLAFVWLLGVPFVSQASLGSGWLVTGEAVLVGSLILTATNLWYASLEVSRRDAWRLFLLAFGIGWAAEACGVHTGVPFGSRYVYHAAFQPHLSGGVPLAIPLSWYVLVRLPVVLLRRHTWSLTTRSLLCGLFMAGTALLLDPLGQSIGLWHFAIEDGARLQVLNALGWGAVTTLITAAYFHLGRSDQLEARPIDERLESLLLTMSAAFHALAIVAAANRFGNAWPLIASTVLMLPCWWVWWRGRIALVVPSKCR
ncbi:MAG: carotenoid biosynthesis protein [Verrucomicrobiaceae bacterium]|nr:carotenoid biosynthesis protein [Verrucomicrobiaceae bacterium]